MTGQLMRRTGNVTTTEELLDKAHAVVSWTTQATLNTDAAGYPHLIAARYEYLKARIDAFAKVRPLTVQDLLGSTCRVPWPAIDEACLYHYGARLQPDNHQIPWNCPTFYDGCNCEPS